MSELFELYDKMYTPSELMEYALTQMDNASSYYLQRKWLKLLDEVWKQYESLLNHEYFHTSSRVLKEKYNRLSEDSADIKEYVAPLPVLDMPCAKITEKGLRGLYFIAMMAHNPEGENFYLVKIGQAEDIGTRMQQYASHNPMIYHNNCSLYINHGSMNEYERNCHMFLKTMAYARAQNALEWYYVTEENYFTLCHLFESPITFASIANGNTI